MIIIINGQALVDAIKRMTAAITSLEQRMDQAHQALNQRIDTLREQVETANTKADTLITLTTDMRAKIQELLDQGAGATPEELQAMVDKIDAATASLQQQGTEDDAAAAGGIPT